MLLLWFVSAEYANEEHYNSISFYYILYDLIKRKRYSSSQGLALTSPLAHFEQYSASRFMLLCLPLRLSRFDLHRWINFVSLMEIAISLHFMLQLSTHWLHIYDPDATLLYEMRSALCLCIIRALIKSGLCTVAPTEHTVCLDMILHMW